MYYRAERVNNLIKEELGKIIVKEMDFSGAMATITNVRISKNMNRAIVGISVFPSSRAADILITINKNHRYLWNLLLKKINLHPMPYVIFEIDPHT